MSRLIHVVGTDTGVGKTAVACALARAMIVDGVDVGVCKPFASGSAPGALPEDARFLMSAASCSDEPELVSPVRFAFPASPWAAARSESVDPGINSACRAVSTLSARHELLIVEGIGGIMTPLSEGVTYLDLVERLGGKTLIVSRAGLGTLNHTLLTLAALKSRNLPVAGVILNRPEEGWDPSEETNPEGIRLFGGVEVLASFPHCREPEAALKMPRPERPFWSRR